MLVGTKMASPNNLLNRPTGAIGTIYLGDGAYVGPTNPNGYNPKLINNAGGLVQGYVQNYTQQAITAALAKGCSHLHIHDPEGYQFVGQLGYVGDIFSGLGDQYMPTIHFPMMCKMIRAEGLIPSTLLNFTAARPQLNGLWFQEDINNGGCDWLILKAQMYVQRFSIGAFYIDAGYNHTLGAAPIAPEAVKMINNLPGVFSMWEWWGNGWLPYMGSPYWLPDKKSSVSLSSLMAVVPPVVVDFSRINLAADPLATLALATAGVKAGTVIQKMDVL
jgi:hypothetical protein